MLETPAAIAEALQHSRRDTLQTFASYLSALPGLQVPQHPALNPPLWELGHIGWFQGWWTSRNPAWAEGWLADPNLARRPTLVARSAQPSASVPADAEALYDSSRVPHEARWSLPLPDAEETRDQLAAQLQQTLALLNTLTPRQAPAAPAAGTSASSQALYFFRLVLLHEDMHHEASLYMAQALGIPVNDTRWHAGRLGEAQPPLALPTTAWHLGVSMAAGAGADSGADSRPDPAFAFDNECGHQPVSLTGGAIDAQVCTWADYLPFVEAGGYTQPQWWTEAGQRWLASSAPSAPRYLRRGHATAWEQSRYGSWRALDPREPACHLTLHEAQAWCRWAGQRLPTEAEWQWAAEHGGDDFQWGQVWEWTASAFRPFPGFTPHPYRDYSQPWFDGRPVLRGASFMTQPRMRRARYRNFFTPERNDIAAGFRSCTP